MIRKSQRFMPGSAFSCYVALIFLFLFTFGCAALENHFIYNPAVYPNGWTKIDPTKFEEVYFESGDGLKLHGILADHAQPKATILYMHGRRGNVTDTLENLEAFVNRHRVRVFAFDYRGFGRSEGMPSESGIYEDARSARKWLARKYAMEESEIILMGHSLGASVAIELASADGAKSLIVESGFTSLPAFINHHIPLIPTRKLLKSRFDSAAKLENYSGRLLIAHGKKDRIIPISQGETLFDASSGPKRMIRLQGGHSGLPTTEYQRAIDQLIADSN